METDMQSSLKMKRNNGRSLFYVLLKEKKKTQKSVEPRIVEK